MKVSGGRPLGDHRPPDTTIKRLFTRLVTPDTV
jgi:hypothetical protein